MPCADCNGRTSPRAVRCARCHCKRLNRLKQGEPEPDEPVTNLGASRGSSAQAAGGDGFCAPSSPADNLCATCGEAVPEQDRAAHAAGRDANRPGCARQSLKAIIQAESHPGGDWQAFLASSG